MSLRAELTARILALPGVEERKSRFADFLAFHVGQREFAHFHSDEELDVRLTRVCIRELGIEGARTDWVAVPLRTQDDVSAALELVERALEASR